ncbi:MAG: hypothetical protein RSD39_02625 [Oscillospiraceae bacterium]
MRESKVENISVILKNITKKMSNKNENVQLPGKKQVQNEMREREENAK